MDHKKIMAKNPKKYSEAISEIEEIIEKIENRVLDVDELTENVKKVSALIKICKDKLHQTEEEIQKILNAIKD